MKKALAIMFAVSLAGVAWTQEPGTNAPPMPNLALQPAVLVPTGTNSLTLEFPVAGITNLLSFIKRVKVDSGFACKFNRMEKLVPSTGQEYALGVLHRGNWRWTILSILHADSFFQDTTEDELGLGTGLAHVKTPAAVTGVTDTINPTPIIDFSNFEASIAAFTESSDCLKGHFEKNNSGVRAYISFGVMK